MTAGQRVAARTLSLTIRAASSSSSTRTRPPNVELLKAAKAAGAKVAFSSGGAPAIDEARLKARLQAIKAAGLGWKDFWVPGKN